jgi:DNA-binding CsgD family transcriptional regulator
LEQGNFQEVVRILRSSQTLSSDNREPREVTFTFVILAEALLACNQLELAVEASKQAREHLPSSQFCSATVDRLDAQIAIGQGDFPRAHNLLRPWLLEPGEVVIEQGRIFELGAELAQKFGQRIDASQLIDQAIAVYERLGAVARLERAKRWREDNARRPRGRPRSTLPAGITPRERDVLDLVIMGRTNKEIAESLVLSVLTVNKHVENIIMKAGVSRRTQLVAWSERVGLRQPARL